MTTSSASELPPAANVAVWTQWRWLPTNAHRAQNEARLRLLAKSGLVRARVVLPGRRVEVFVVLDNRADPSSSGLDRPVSRVVDEETPSERADRQGD